MKKYLFLATAIATASLFTGCSNNEYVGDQPDALNGTDGAIVFSMGKANTTRVEKTGDDAAKMLNKVFYVYGEKYTVTPEEAEKVEKVFNTYKVKYNATPANSTASNTKGWEYVLTNPWEGNERNNVSGGVEDQTIKYWDYSASKYTFYAFSAKTSDVTGTDPNIKVSAIEKTSTDPSGRYTVTIKEGADIEKLYFADYVKINKPSTPPITANPAAKGEYGGYVEFTFRNLASKVRVGFYETVPGYSIKIDKMYGANTDASTSEFKAECPNTKAKQNSQITVTYNGDNGYAVVSGKKKEDGNSDLSAVNTLTLGDEVFKAPLSNTSSSPTWDTNGGKYTFFWPQTNNGNPLKIKVDYTLTSTDGSGETIKVTGATATVPADYVKWAANTAYTYIFKISKNTNGTTGGGSGPEGLYPITFDAVVEDYTNEGSITTVSTPSVTAKQDGTTNGYVSVNDNGIVFQTGKTIELKVMTEEGAVESPKITGGYIEGDTYNYDFTPEKNLTDAGVEINTVTLDDNKLAVKTNPGYWVLKVTYSNAKTDVFTYVIIRVGSAEEGPANPANQ